MACPFTREQVEFIAETFRRGVALGMGDHTVALAGSGPATGLTMRVNLTEWDGWWWMCVSAHAEGEHVKLADALGYSQDPESAIATFERWAKEAA